MTLNVGEIHRTIAATSTAPSIPQQIALRCSPAPKYPAAALKQRIALVHPLAQAAGLLSIFRIRMSYPIGIESGGCDIACRSHLVRKAVDDKLREQYADSQ